VAKYEILFQNFKQGAENNNEKFGTVGTGVGERIVLKYVSMTLHGILRTGLFWLNVVTGAKLLLRRQLFFGFR
jgi:hypothetical protein